MMINMIYVYNKKICDYLIMPSFLPQNLLISPSITFIYYIIKLFEGKRQPCLWMSGDMRDSSKISFNFWNLRTYLNSDWACLCFTHNNFEIKKILINIFNQILDIDWISYINSILLKKVSTIVSYQNEIRKM